MPSFSRPSRSRGCIEDGSGGTMLSSGLMAFAMRAMTRGIFVIGFGILWRVTVDLAAGEVVVIPGSQIVAVFRGRESARQGQDLQAMLRQFQVTDDLRTQQADHIGELGEFVAGEDLLRHRCAADDMAALQHDDLPAGARR